MRPSPRQAAALLRSVRPAVRCRGASQPTQLLFPRRLSTTLPQSASPGPSSSSVNATEISHFSALASSWWDPHGPSRPLHLMNPLRHDFIRACISSSSSPSASPAAHLHPHSPPDQLHYLDIGCGGGIFAESAARLPTTASVTAIDPSPAILAVARAHAKRDPSLRQKLRYLEETVESLPLPAPAPAGGAGGPGGGGYDVVSVFEVVEHVDHPARFLDRVGEFVRPGGWLVMSTIARTWTSWVVTNLVAEDLLGVVPKGTHDWAKYVNVEELEAYFRGKGGRWGDIRVMGVVYVPGLGWREVKGGEKVGNYFLGVQRAD
ncbi:Ubiquinone biosynthesis O-methyltransferase, mitochondrial [Madurella mycetomatis]|uniref:Ubiquinone biosynthesis O-methyltransferase, mitochondrial n=1 Tax=Madurella mycetomatis TaxID=100816 RepID=A0A175VZC8_9PEZI|nr:Ubiquinone biosynthesis O-methyltransferase, mitochondrial [Madurella mycetomatis]